MFAEPLTRMAQKFGPADYCSLMALGLVAAVILASGSVIKAIAMIFLGLLFGLVGTDVNTGAQRFTLDMPELSDGIDFAPIAMWGVSPYLLVVKPDFPANSVQELVALLKATPSMT